MDLDRKGRKDDLLQTTSFPVLLTQGLESNDLEMLNVSTAADFSGLRKWGLWTQLTERVVTAYGNMQLILCVCEFSQMLCLVAIYRHSPTYHGSVLFS